jgi:hypothetical protein
MRSVVKVVSSMGLEWQAAFGIVVGLYFYSHYFFASGAWRSVCASFRIEVVCILYAFCACISVHRLRVILYL